MCLLLRTGGKARRCHCRAFLHSTVLPLAHRPRVSGICGRCLYPPRSGRGFDGSWAFLVFSLTPERAVAVIVVWVEIREVFTAIIVAVRWL